MELRNPEWLALAADTDGPGFARFQRELTRYNRHRLEPSLPYAAWRAHLRHEGRVAEAEGDFVEAVRQEIAPLVRDIPLARHRPRSGRSAVYKARGTGEPRTDEVVHRAGGGGGGGF